MVFDTYRTNELVWFYMVDASYTRATHGGLPRARPDIGGAFAVLC